MMILDSGLLFGLYTCEHTQMNHTLILLIKNKLVLK